MFVDSTNFNADLMQRDLRVLWHPCTQMKDHETIDLVPIKSGRGVWLYDFNGKGYIDAVSSWWVNLFGHANPTINERVKAQLDQLEHVILAGFSHEPVVELSEALVRITPPGLDKCFFADNGSSAIEAALKMSFHYWLNTGNRQKTKFVTLDNAYHGETLAALAVSNVPLYKETYGPLLMESINVPSPDCYHRELGETWEAYSDRMFRPMEQVLRERHTEICAVMVEPLVQCAGGMRMHHPVYLKRLREACDRYNVHLIADEIAVGFGRTGTLFACEQANITPDYMCLSKGITGGYLPLSVVMTTQAVYDAFYDAYDSLKAFLHSHSYTGNALACAAALATIDIFEQEQVIESNQSKIKAMAGHAERFKDHPHVAEVRQTGMILAVEMIKNKKTKTPFPWQERRGFKVFRHALEQGVLLRPLGNVIYFMPPYVINSKEMQQMFDAAWSGIQVATQDA